MSHTDDLSTVVFFLAVGLIAGQLAGRLRRQMEALRTTSEQTQTQAELNRRLAAAPDLDTMAAVAAATLAERFRAPVLVLAPGDTGSDALAELAASQSDLVLDDKSRHAAQWAFDHRQPSGQFTNTLANAPWRFVPLHVNNEAFGVLAVRFPVTPAPHGEILATLEVLVASVALAMARTRLADHLERARIAEETERLRSALLSSVSHDLRSPLASMIGSASSLRDLDDDLSASDRTSCWTRSSARASASTATSRTCWT